MNKISNRLLCLLVAVVMIATMLPTAFATEPAYTDWDGSASAIVDGAYLKLTDNIEIDERYVLQDVTVTIDLNGKTITSDEAIQFMYITTGAEVTLKNGTVEMPGLSADSGSVMGGLIQLQSGAVGLTLENMTITKTGDTTGLSNAAILYARKPVLIKDSTLQVTAAAQGGARQEGGLIKLSSGCTLTVENSTLVGTTAAYGGCIFATGSGAIVIESGTVTGGTATTLGDDIYATSSATVTINGGEVGKIYARGNSVAVNGGTVHDWTKKSGSFTVGAGVTTYANPNSVATGCEAYVMDKSGEQTKYTTYAKLDAAMAAAKAGNTVSLLANTTADAVVVPAGVTFNLYGKTLTAASLTATAEGAQIKDEKSNENAGGKLICNNIAVAEDNKFAPIYFEGAYHFQKYTVAENLQDNVYKFYLADAAEDLLLDDVWAAGYANSGLQLEIVATYKLNGVEKEAAFVVSSELVETYIAGWDSKMFILTITSDLTNVTDLDFTVRVVAA